MQEFLLERALLKAYSPSGEIDMKMMFAPPRGLCNGKGAAETFAAGTEFSQGLRRCCPELADAGSSECSDFWSR